MRAWNNSPAAAAAASAQSSVGSGRDGEHETHRRIQRSARIPIRYTDDVQEYKSKRKASNGKDEQGARVSQNRTYRHADVHATREDVQSIEHLLASVQGQLAQNNPHNKMASFVMNACKGKLNKQIELCTQASDAQQLLNLHRKMLVLQNVRLFVPLTAADAMPYVDGMYLQYRQFVKAMVSQHSNFETSSYGEFKALLLSFPQFFVLAIYEYVDGYIRKEAVIGYSYFYFNKSMKIGYTAALYVSDQTVFQDINELYVNERGFTGLGIGEALLFTAEMICRYNKVEFFFLYVSDNAFNAKGLYKKFMYSDFDELGYNPQEPGGKGLRILQNIAAFETIRDGLYKLKKSPYTSSGVYEKVVNVDHDLILFKEVYDGFSKGVIGMVESLWKMGGIVTPKKVPSPSGMPVIAPHTHRCISCNRPVLMYTSSLAEGTVDDIRDGSNIVEFVQMLWDKLDF
jgi:ribosomal protein S18 acetylase RimI-like enzyme